MFTTAPLPYDYDFLEPIIDAQTMHVHHDGHYTTYVDNLNKILVDYPELSNKTLTELLQSIDQVPEQIRQKVINNAGGVFNHQFYWAGMTKNGTELGVELSKKINATFGSFNKFKDEFTLAASSVFGSGYTWLVLDNNQLIITSTSNQDCPITKYQTPLIGLDVWEHAYYLKYLNKRKDYIENWWKIVNFQEVEKILINSPFS